MGVFFFLGGSVISTRCSETHQTHTAQFSILGIPLWYYNNSPRTVIQVRVGGYFFKRFFPHPSPLDAHFQFLSLKPGVNPGECWAFKGSTGYLVIQLSGRVRITAVSLEHIPKSISPSGNIDSAPKEFTVKVRWFLKVFSVIEDRLLTRWRFCRFLRAWTMRWVKVCFLGTIRMMIMVPRFRLSPFR